MGSPHDGRTGLKPRPDGFVLCGIALDDGLPVNTVRDLGQVPQGYLWMTTFAGLVRFDGVEFESTTAARSGPPTDRLRRVERGVDGALWIRTNGEQLAVGDLFRRATSGAEWIPVGPDSLDIVSVESAQEGGGWIGTVAQGVWRAIRQVTAQTSDEYRLEGSRLVCSLPPLIGKGERVRQLIARPDDTLWIWTGGGRRYRIDAPFSETVTVRRLGGRTETHRVVREGPEGHPLIMTNDQIQVTDRPALEPNGPANALYFDQEGHL